VFSLYLNIHGLQTGPEKIFMGVLEKYWIFVNTHLKMVNWAKW